MNYLICKSPSSPISKKSLNLVIAQCLVMKSYHWFLNQLTNNEKMLRKLNQESASECLSLWVTMPFCIRSGISTASQGPSPSAIAWAIPNLGTFLAQRGLKWSVRQIFPPLYILAVLPSSSGRAISMAVVGYVIGISNSTSNSYLRSSWMYQHFPNQRVPSVLDSKRNQSLSDSLLFWTYLIRLWYSSLSLVTHNSPSLGPAFVFKSGICARVRFVASSPG